MVDEKIIEAGGGDPNPARGNNAPPLNPPVQNLEPAIDAQVKTLTEKLDRLTNQYDGSTKEALRLKEENEKLKTQVENAKDTGKFDEVKFQKLVEDKGLLAALDSIFGSKVSSLEARIEGLLTKESNQIFSDFVATHKGLTNVEVQKRFDVELGKLKSVYTDVNEAMEKAYLLAGGKEAESQAAPVVPAPAKPDEKEIVKSVLGGEGDQVPGTPTKPIDTAKAIQDLQLQAAQLDLQGKTRMAAKLYAQIEDLKSTVKPKA